MSEARCVVGIDLGTTNSEIAAQLDGRVKVLGKGTRILPSCVGFTPAGELLVGTAARNQLTVYPDLVVRSIKRKMGGDEKVRLGDREFSPQEISSLILRELVEWARMEMGAPVEKAVITVPAYFSDAQRQATREAGLLAGLEVERILNEPTAASLAYGFGGGEKRTVLIYDLGGGTFDVSVVTTENDVTEVLSSHGNNRLGGDDFDDLLVSHLAARFAEQCGVDVRQGHPIALARVRQAAEEAKKKLSYEPYAQIREESLVMDGRKPLHLVLELSRDEYEEMIRPLVSSTLDSVSRALEDARLRAQDLDAILLVGGSTRTPLVSRLLQQTCGLRPRQEVHPDLCVALGAGVLGARLGGHQVERVLVDVSPYSFGPSHLGERGGFPYPHCYRPIIERNTPLPVTRTETYFAFPGQKRVEIEVFQGEDEDAMNNILIGDFTFDGLSGKDDDNEVLCRMQLDVDGILHVSAIEKDSGRSAHVTISNALKAKSEAEVAAARKRLESLFSRSAFAAADDEEVELDPTFATTVEVDGSLDDRETFRNDGVDSEAPALLGGALDAELALLIERSRGLLERMHAEDAEEAIELHERITAAAADGDAEALAAAETALRELLFFVEGR